MRKINKEVKNNILRKTPWGHSSTPHKEGLNEEQIKGLFYKAITDEENSVISEINRIVEEGNKQFSEIDNTEYFGKIENDSFIGSDQNWIRNGNLVYVYGNIHSYTFPLNTMPTAITNIRNGKNLVMRLTAPEGVVPDNSLTLTIGENTYSGLTLLRNTAEEAMNGIYFLRFAIPVNKIRKETVTVKWNEESGEETVVFDFNDDYAQSTEKKLYIRFASSASGSDSSVNWSNGKEYVGFYYSDSDALPTAYKWARFSQPSFGWTAHQCEVTSWNSDKQAVVSLQSVNENSILIVEPIYSSYTQWHNSKIRLKTQGNGTLTLICDSVPSEAIAFRVLVGNQAN